MQCLHGMEGFCADRIVFHLMLSKQSDIGKTSWSFLEGIEDSYDPLLLKSTPLPNTGHIHIYLSPIYNKSGNDQE